MRSIVYSVLAIYCIVMVLGNPGLRETSIKAGPSVAECRAARDRDTCLAIIEEAASGGGRFRGLLHAFQHYCRKIPPYVPCLEANKENYRVLLHCSGSEELVTWEQIWTFDELWEMSINFLETTNDIICSQTEELVALIGCLQKKKDEFIEKGVKCIMPHMSLFSGEALSSSMICGALYDVAGCMRDTISSMCTGSSDLLDTFYADVVVGAVGTSMGCEAEPNPLLGFARMVKDKLRR